jgi:hypothetical protein
MLATPPEHGVVMHDDYNTDALDMIEALQSRLRLWPRAIQVQLFPTLPCPTNPTIFGCVL